MSQSGRATEPDREFAASAGSGAFDKLPGHTFSRGYIRAYAKLMEASTRPSWSTASTISPAPMPAAAPVQSLGRVAEPVHLSRNVRISSVWYYSPC
ncbi:hypothetical protein P4118_05300 [Pseudomonas aeruginosa]|nr:hypothetical protein [Pseudomonas aeruginosa]